MASAIAVDKEKTHTNLENAGEDLQTAVSDKKN